MENGTEYLKISGYVGNLGIHTAHALEPRLFQTKLGYFRNLRVLWLWYAIHTKN